jgi:hypothetical protein
MSITKTLPPAHSHFISLEKGVEMTTRCRENKENILAAAFKNQNIIPNSETFNRGAIDTLLAQDDCAGIRVYYSMDEELKVHAIMVAVTESNEDILPSGNNISDEDETVIVEEGQRCPTICPNSSPLNP